MITIFSLPAKSPREPFSLVLSVLMHATLITVAFFGLSHAPRIQEVGLSERYSFRRLEMRMTKRQIEFTSKSATDDPRPQFLTDAASRWQKESDLVEIANLIAQQYPPHRLLIQPDAPLDATLSNDMYLPSVLLWSTEGVSAQRIVPPPPQMKTAADVPQSLELPNRETTLAELNLTPSAFTSEAIHIVPSSTSPLTVLDADLEKRVQETNSEASREPSQTRIMSLSEHFLPTGTTLVPRANDAPFALSPGAAGRVHSNGHAEVHSALSESEASGQGTGSSAVRDILVRHITMPKDGRFSMVLVGNSVEEQYPEAAEVWTGRLAYTVYLHLGLMKNWILQYSLPRLGQEAGMGNAGRLEAPWPTDILVPELPDGFANGDALIVHGLLNKDGRFEALATVFPPNSAQAKFLLDTLHQWIFRPAMQNGQMAAVEVLLIIPE
jgi:hypothetical protein